MRKILEAIIIGVVFGLLTHIATTYLPDVFQFLFESKLIWILPAFLIAFNMPLRRRETDSIIVATIELLSTGASYYILHPFIIGNGLQIPQEFIQLVPLGIAVGIATGVFAYLGHSATNQIVRYSSISLLPAIYTGDGINEIIKSLEHFELTPEILTKVIGGLLLYLLISGSHRFKAKSLSSFAVLIAVAALVYLNMV